MVVPFERDRDLEFDENVNEFTDHLLCVRVRTVVKVYVLLNSILLVQYCLIHVYGSRLTSEYMK